MTQVLGLCLTTSGLRQNNDGPWVQGGRPRGRGLSAVLLHQGRLLGQSLPVLHHHPEPARPLLIEGLPFEQIRYDLADPGFEVHEEATADWNKRSEEHTSELQSLMRISYAVFCLKK